MYAIVVLPSRIDLLGDALEVIWMPLPWGLAIAASGAGRRALRRQRFHVRVIRSFSGGAVVVIGITALAVAALVLLGTSLSTAFCDWDGEASCVQAGAASVFGKVTAAATVGATVVLAVAWTREPASRRWMRASTGTLLLVLAATIGLWITLPR